MELQYLVDVNLPKYFHYFNSDNFRHVVDINPKMTDQDIWDYAIHHNLVILTKDTDFYNRFISSAQSPKIVYFQLGNQTLQELHNFFQSNWNTIQTALPNNSLIIAKSLEILFIQ